MSQDTSVIIPTLQKSEHLHDILQIFDAHPRVAEILLINNAPEPLHELPAKVRVLQQAENIYVNPAWNLGAAVARGTNLVIANDDIIIDHDLIDYALDLIDRRVYSLVGVERSFVGTTRRARAQHRPAVVVNTGFGALMFLRRADYPLIPQTPKIYAGDDWIFWNQPRIPGVVLGFPVRTEMGTTSGRREFNAVAQADRDWWFNETHPVLVGSKLWHRALPVIMAVYTNNRRMKRWADVARHSLKR